jgi:signal transduction histidine kinase
MRTRDLSVRTKILALLLAPLLALVALWIVATAATLDAARSLTAAQTYRDYARTPAERLIDQLQQERKLSIVYLGSKRADPKPLTDQRADQKPLADQRSRTDAALAAYRKRVSSGELAGAANDLTKQRLRDLAAALETLPAARETIDNGELDRAGTMRLYTGMVDAAYRMLVPLTDVGDWQVARLGRAVVALGAARDALAREDALLAGVAAAGTLGDADLSQIVQAVGVQRALYADAAAELSDADRAAYQRVAKGDASVSLQALEDKVVANGRAGSPVPVDMAAWRVVYDTTVKQLRDVERGAAKTVAAAAGPVGDGIFSRLWLATLLGLAAIIGSVLLALWLSRSLTGRLHELRAAAADLAHNRLPALLARLQRGEDVEVATETAEAPAMPRGRDEIGQIGKAFDEVRRTIVRSAVADARHRQGLGDVFSTIAQRSQDLMHRQLTLLDGMERRITEPADLEDLFRVDHLATRTRRQAEELAVLAGAVPGRGWHKPVPMADVIRGAVSEVEDYARVTTVAVPEVALVGRAVGDAIHLLAELIENGTTFAQHARVQVSGELVPNGFAIEIEDRGSGMTAEALAEANRRLAEPPGFGADEGTQLGLFVVAQLAARHNVRVRLRASPYGGITAVVLIPAELVVIGPDGPPNWDTPTVAQPGLAAAAAIAGKAAAAKAAPSRSSAGTAGTTGTANATGQKAAPAKVATLPRRVRQASLAPQLREQDGAPGP